MKKIVVIGRRGTIVHVDEEENDPIIMAPPLVEVDCNFDTGEPFYINPNNLYREIVFKVSPIYSGWNKFGHFGDIIVVSRIFDNCYKIDLIGRFAYPSSRIAADILPFIVTPDGRIFFIGGIKRSELEAYKVLIGGFVDTDKEGMESETRAEAAIREAKEEAGLNIEVADKDKQVFINRPIPHHLSIIVDLKGRKIKSDLWLLDTFKTAKSDAECILKRKRVHETTAYFLKIQIPQNLNAGDIKDLFTPDDDVKDILVWQLRSGDISDVEESPGFLEAHHTEIYFEAVRRVKEILMAEYGVF